MSSIKSVKRRVTLYSNDGKVLRVWEGRLDIEVIGSFVFFVDESGSHVKVSGTIVVEEF